jgi:RNA polymerase sigma-70 factor (ECF subfamily)
MPLFQEDRPLLDAFRRGERAALTRVYLYYVDELAELVRRGFSTASEGRPLRVPGASSPDEQAEVIQETFVRAFSEPARSAYDGVRPFRPYLFRIAKNLLIDRLRARRREPGPALADAAVVDIDRLLETNAALPAEPPARPDSDLDWLRLSRSAREFLAGLDSETRELVRLRFEEDRSQEDAAEQMRVSRRRVRTLEARVVARLRRHLRKAGLLPTDPPRE